MDKRLLQTSLSAGRLMFLAAIIWIFVIAASFVWNWHQVSASIRILAENAAQFSFTLIPPVVIRFQGLPIYCTLVPKNKTKGYI